MAVPYMVQSRVRYFDRLGACEGGCLCPDPKGRTFTENDHRLGTGDARADGRTRQGGPLTGGPAPMTPKDRSRFCRNADEAPMSCAAANPANE